MGTKVPSSTAVELCISGFRPNFLICLGVANLSATPSVVSVSHTAPFDISIHMDRVASNDAVVFDRLDAFVQYPIQTLAQEVALPMQVSRTAQVQPQPCRMPD